MIKKDGKPKGKELIKIVKKKEKERSSKPMFNTTFISTGTT